MKAAMAATVVIPIDFSIVDLLSPVGDIQDGKPLVKKSLRRPWRALSWHNLGSRCYRRWERSQDTRVTQGGAYGIAQGRHEAGQEVRSTMDRDQRGLALAIPCGYLELSRASLAGIPVRRLLHRPAAPAGLRGAGGYGHYADGFPGHLEQRSRPAAGAGDRLLRRVRRSARQQPGGRAL